MYLSDVRAIHVTVRAKKMKGDGEGKSVPSWMCGQLDWVVAMLTAKDDQAVCFLQVGRAGDMSMHRGQSQWRRV